LELALLKFRYETDQDEKGMAMQTTKEENYSS
jgi:hypothetical protein